MAIRGTKKLSPKLNGAIETALADGVVENKELRKIRRTLYADIDKAPDRVALTKAGQAVFEQLAPKAADKKAQTYIKITTRVLAERVLVEQAAQALPAYLKEHRASLSPLLKRIIVEDRSVRPGAAKATPPMQLGSYQNGAPWLGVYVKRKPTDDAMTSFHVQDAVKELMAKTPELKAFADLSIICQWDWS